MKQSWRASWFEIVGSTATGFLLSLGIQYGICWWWHLPLHLHDNLTIIAIFTVASILRGMLWRRLMERFHVRRRLTPAMQAVIAERYRQFDEGWDHEHDDGLSMEELPLAGAAYLVSAAGRSELARKIWPWSDQLWLPDIVRPRRDYTRGLALGTAGLEKFDRAGRRAP